jgi:hypothetical protein
MGLEGYEGVSEDHARVLMAVRGYHAIGQAPDIGNIGNACDIGVERTEEAMHWLRANGLMPDQQEA